MIVHFPFSDLSNSKRRPAVVIRQLPGDNVILCQVTSRAVSDGFAVSLEDVDFKSAQLTHRSNVRPNRLFTADRHIVLYRAGTLTQSKIEEIITAVVRVCQE